MNRKMEEFEPGESGHGQAGQKRIDGPAVSIIVPTYNTPIDLLFRCLNSLIRQTYVNIEIIIVDDGSKPQYREDISRVAELDSRVVLIDSPHGGASHARNMGINCARGDWIAFADADDEVELEFVSEALSCASDDIDLICGHVEPIFAKERGVSHCGGCGSTWFTVDSCEIFAAADQMLAYRKNRLFPGPDFKGRGPVAKLYRANKIGPLRFNEDMEIAEDELFNYKFIRKSNGIAIVDKVWYRYFQREGSVLHSVTLSKIRKSMSALLSTVEPGEDPSTYYARCVFMVLEGSSYLAMRRSSLTDIASLVREAEKYGIYRREFFQNYVLNLRQSVFVYLCSLRCWLAAVLWVWATQRFKLVLHAKGTRLYSKDLG